MKKVLFGTVVLVCVWVSGYTVGHRAGYSFEHAKRVSDEIALLKQANDVQLGTIATMDARYRSISNEIDRLESENTRLIRASKAKREEVEHAIKESATWNEDIVPSAIADGLREYAASGDEAIRGAGAKNPNSTIQSSRRP